MSVAIFDIDTLLTPNRESRQDTERMLSILKALGVRLGAVSSQGDHRALVELLEAGFGQYFDYKGCTDTPGVSGPSPIHTVLGHLGVGTDERVAFVSGGDSDISYGSSAGFVTVGVGQEPAHIGALIRAGADHVVPVPSAAFDHLAC